ncbi:MULTISPECIES: alpha/beta fold hydrolase [Fischerella]|uniref:Alpha/beta hydrolase n=1 Tax=Fischerella muscicola CCMEE 5323 TaxID=2019572 RepID=A0A2N6K2R8_FISMU|nr:alpha/beta hydrolase [Fischerella muscicola]MBD2435149.1 alpha/beta hydrolase [Fischerella sp. FACHB-380]PLZ89557.1 alpha/beta hydrolase [Fischerella muscicola CCMEE 5323]
MPKALVNGIELFYNIHGTGEPLLLIAGFDSDSLSWSVLMPFLVKHYQVIRFDNRGVGQSSAPNSPYSIQQMAADTIALLEYLKISQVYVVGHSMGGQIAQELTLAQPEIVQSLILLSSWAKGDSKFQAIMELFGDLPSKLDPLLYQTTLLPWLFSDRFYATPGAIEQIVNQIRKYPFLPESYALYHQSRAILNSDTFERLASIEVPTLVMVGEQDIVTPIKFSEHLAQGIPNAELVILEQVGHACFIESPEIVAQEMLKFLTNH